MATTRAPSSSHLHHQTTRRSKASISPPSRNKNNNNNNTYYDLVKQATATPNTIEQETRMPPRAQRTSVSSSASSSSSSSPSESSLSSRSSSSSLSSSDSLAPSRLQGELPLPAAAASASDRPSPMLTSTPVIDSSTFLSPALSLGDVQYEEVDLGDNEDGEDEGEAYSFDLNRARLSLNHQRILIRDYALRPGSFLTDDEGNTSNASNLIPSSIILPQGECVVCLEEKTLRHPSPCCSNPICERCFQAHLASHINEARIRIPCSSCSHIFSRDEVLAVVSGELAEKYKRFYADINKEVNIKTCPRCCAIKELDRKLFSGNAWRRTAPRKVNCDECKLDWCFMCHAPWHEKMTCKEYREGEKMLRSWAAQMDQNQQNAQQCPRCKVFISRNGGCPHMICSKCHCDFCYNCGKRRLGLKFLGTHESRWSPLGCKYNLYPNKPVLRRTVRGLVAGAATLAFPVAAVGAVALLAVGTTIGAPTYGTYRLVKHLRARRRMRNGQRTRQLTRQMTQSLSEANGLSSWSMPSSIAEEVDDDLRRALEESLETYREEREKAMTPYPNRRSTTTVSTGVFRVDDDDVEEEEEEEEEGVTSLYA